MAVVSKSGTPSITTLSPDPENQLPLIAGEAIAAGDSCYIKGSDGKAYRSDGTAANAAAKCDGFAGMAAAINKPVTLYRGGIVFAYGAGLTPGARYFVAATAGQL